MASASGTCLPCNQLYEPNPDIAGQAIFVAFLAHTSIFIFLAMIVTPIISFYLPPVLTRAVGESSAIPLQVEELQIREESGFRRYSEESPASTFGLLLPSLLPPVQVEELQVRVASGPRHHGLNPPAPQPDEIEQLDLPLLSDSQHPERDSTPRYLYRCYCQQTIESTYTSQYISGIAFIVTAFVKWREISPYHLRIIYSIVSMHTMIGLVANFNRQSFLSLLVARLHLSAGRAPAWSSLAYKALDCAFLLNLLLLTFFTVLVPIYSYRDQCFQPCYEKSTWTYAVSVIFFYALVLFSTHRNGDNGPLGGTVFTSLIALFIGFQVWQFQELTLIFRPEALAPGISSELSFSFGQILVLFMILPLVTEHSGALYVDSKRIVEYSGKDVPTGTLFINFFRILLPWYINRLANAIITGLERLLIAVSEGASRIKTAVSSSRKIFPRRTNTSRLESGSTGSRQGSIIEMQGIDSVAEHGVESQATASTPVTSRRLPYPRLQEGEIEAESVLQQPPQGQPELRDQ